MNIRGTTGIELFNPPKLTEMKVSAKLAIYVKCQNARNIFRF